MVTYYPNGQLSMKGNYKNGKKEGSWEFYEDGQLRRKVTYKKEKKEGPAVRYYDNGQLSMKGNYKNGKKEGSWNPTTRMDSQTHMQEPIRTV